MRSDARRHTTGEAASHTPDSNEHMYDSNEHTCAPMWSFLVILPV